MSLVHINYSAVLCLRAALHWRYTGWSISYCHTLSTLFPTALVLFTSLNERMMHSRIISSSS